MLAELPILFAAPWNELVSVLVGLVFLVIWVINQINDARKKQATEVGRPVDVPLEPMEAAAPQAGPQGGGQADPLRAQVDEFLPGWAAAEAPCPAASCAANRERRDCRAARRIAGRAAAEDAFGENARGEPSWSCAASSLGAAQRSPPAAAASWW